MKQVKIIITTTAILAFSTSSFSNNKKEKTEKIKLNKEVTTPSGLKYTILKTENGKKPMLNDKVQLHYQIRTMKDSVIEDTWKTHKGSTYNFRVGGNQVSKGLEEGIQFLHKGDSAVLVMKPELLTGGNTSAKIPANTSAKYVVKFIDITEAPKPFDVKGKDTVTTPSGLKYIITTQGTGGAPKSGDKIQAHYTGFFANGKIFDSSVERGQPFSFAPGKGQVIKGWDEAFSILNKGAKARLVIPFQLAYGEAGRPPQIPAKSTLIFDVELVDIIPGIAAKPYDISGKEKIKTPSGLEYVIVQKGTGKKVEGGKMIKLHYTGYFEDGKIFDSSVERGEPAQFPVGTGGLIKGFEEGLMLMSVGDKYHLMIPYTIAYGEQGFQGAIPPKANLIFDVEIIDIMTTNATPVNTDGHDHSDPNHKH